MTSDYRGRCMKNCLILIAAIGAAVIGFFVQEQNGFKRQRVVAQNTNVDKQVYYDVSNVCRIDELRKEMNVEMEIIGKLSELIEIFESEAITRGALASKNELDDGEPGKNGVAGICLEDDDVNFAIEVWQRLIEALIESVISKETAICLQEAKNKAFYENLAKRQNNVDTTRCSITIDRRYSPTQRTACMSFIEGAQKRLEAQARLTTGANSGEFTETPDNNSILLL